MRVSGQLAVIAVLGAAGFGGWYAYKGGHLANLPVIGAYVSQPPHAAGRRSRRPWPRRSGRPCGGRRGHRQDRAHRRDAGIGRHGACLRIDHCDRQGGRHRRRDRLRRGPEGQGRGHADPVRCRRAARRDRAGRGRGEPRRGAPQRSRHQARTRPGAQPHRRRHRRPGRRPDRPGQVARRLDRLRPTPSARPPRPASRT